MILPGTFLQEKRNQRRIEFKIFLCYVNYERMALMMKHKIAAILLTACTTISAFALSAPSYAAPQEDGSQISEKTVEVQVPDDSILKELGEKIKNSIPTADEIDRLYQDSVVPKQTLRLVKDSPNPAFPTGDFQYYFVQPGDTVKAIAEKFHTDPIVIRHLNALENNTIYPGERFVVPYTGEHLGKVYIIGQTVNIRSGPGETFPVQTKLQYGTGLGLIIEKGNWVQVLLPDQTKGWIAKWLISSSVPSRGSNSRNPGPKAPKYILGFYTDQEGEIPSSYPTVIDQSENISAIAPFWWRLSPKTDGTLSASGAQTNMKKVIADAQEKNIKVLVLVHNLLYGKTSIGKDILHEILKSPEKQENFIGSLLWLIEFYGYDGVNIDIENIHTYDRDAYSQFIEKVSARLKAKGHLVTISVAAKTYDDPKNSWSGPIDYKRLGKAVDLVLIMTYDEHSFTSAKPGPIASLGWQAQVVKFAASQIDSSKVLLGIPGYAYDWNLSGGKTAYISYAQAMDRAKKYNAKIKWDDKAKVPYFDYWDSSGAHHQVWFENSESLDWKLGLVNKYNLRGIGLWRLGMEDPDMWRIIAQNFIAE